jgi:hypothetical protein
MEEIFKKFREVYQIDKMKSPRLPKRKKNFKMITRARNLKRPKKMETNKNALK